MKHVVLPLFLIVTLLLSACAAMPSNTIKIGLEGADDRRLCLRRQGLRERPQAAGRPDQRGRRHQRPEVELIVEDDKGDPKEASLVADRLVSKKVVAVIGAYNSSATEPASAIYNRENILHITPSSTATRLTEKGYQQFFRVCFLDDRQGLFAAEFMTKVLGNKNIAILHDNSTYAQGLAEWTKKYLEERGLKIVFYDAINPKDTGLHADADQDQGRERRDGLLHRLPRPGRPAAQAGA